MLTYGDGVANIDINQLIAYHQDHGKTATMTAVQPGSRFGIIQMEENNVINSFIEKPRESGSWINGGFFVLKPAVFQYLLDDADQVMWEKQPLEDLASAREIVAYKHDGYWKCMDTLRDKEELEEQWQTDPKWKSW
jgi:glucose-1-phosphate cytidylyltransferase